MSSLAKLTARGQLTIPKDVRDALHLVPGTEFHISAENGRLLVTPKDTFGSRAGRKTVRLMDLAGILGRPPNGDALTIEEMDEAIGEAIAEDDDRIRREWHEGRK